MTLPLTLATFRGIRVRVASQEFIFPTQSVSQVFRLSSEKKEAVQEQEVVSYKSETLPFVPLSDLLHLSSPSSQEEVIVLVVTAAERSIAIGVDEILSEEEVLVKGLGKQLLRVNHIAAATILESGKIIPILDSFDLIKTAIEQGKAFK